MGRIIDKNWRIISKCTNREMWGYTDAPLQNKREMAFLLQLHNNVFLL